MISYQTMILLFSRDLYVFEVNYFQFISKSCNTDTFYYNFGYYTKICILKTVYSDNIYIIIIKNEN